MYVVKVARRLEVVYEFQDGDRVQRAKQAVLNLDLHHTRPFRHLSSDRSVVTSLLFAKSVRPVVQRFREQRVHRPYWT